jgi:tripartite-type tricarboxylate transporter receptor subunit TctC
MQLRRRGFLQLLAAAGAVPAASPFASAQNFPPRVIRIIVPFPPGGTLDPIARMVQPGLQERLGTTVIIENKPGASGAIGTALAAKSPPDGSNWVMVFDTHAVNPFLQNLPFDTEKDLDPVLLIGSAPNVLSANPEKPFSSFADVLITAKTRPQTITYASIGSGSLGHLTGVLLSERAGVRLVHVPYRGGGPAMNDAIAGHVDLLIGSAALVTPQVKSGRLRALLQTGKSRIPALPDVPTAIEVGFPGFESYAWWGMFTPAPTPKPIIERFSAALVETLRDPAISTQITDNMQITMLLADAEAERKFLVQQMKLWGSVVREHGIVAGTE